MEFHSVKLDAVFQELNSSKKGLSDSEAGKRLVQYGRNELIRSSGDPWWALLLDQFQDMLILILALAALISTLLGEQSDGLIIVIILTINGIIGFYQEFKAEKAIESLKKLSPRHANVLRDGKEVQVDASELVPGDVIVINAGDNIPADARIIESFSMEVQESALTGESVSTEKKRGKSAPNSAVGDRHNMVFLGTITTRGKAFAIVTGTGMNTQLGKIAGLLAKTKKTLTPLQKKLEHFGKVIGGIVLGLCAIIFAAGILRSFEPLEMFLISVSLAVAAVPEGLPAVVTITLSLGVQKMVKRNALVRKLASVETLGSTQIICTDKTGTLTHDQMTVKQIYVDGKTLKVTGDGYSSEGKISAKTANLELLLKIGVLCNDSRLEGTDHTSFDVGGDPTEGALLISGMKGGHEFSKLDSRFPRVDEVPFDSERKRMTTIHKDGRKKLAFCKGATSSILEACTHIKVGSRIKKLSAAEKKKINELDNSFAKQALRVLSFAYKEVKSGKTESNMIFVGMQAMIDPPRQEAIDAIAKCKAAGIKVVMITGDHKLTAQAIGKKMGITGKAIDGEELDKIQDLSSKVNEISIYARVNPAHKMKIVEAWQKKGYTVAMTGDGVNDAPSLKKADIGVSMGITGTDVAKEASDMILTDDNFASLVAAVEEGRTIFDNIQKFVEYLLSCNMGEVLVVFIAIVIGFPMPLSTVQILWMNLVTDMFPATALGLNPAEPGIMSRKPKPKTRVVDAQGLRRMIYTALIIKIGTLGVFWYFDPWNSQALAMTAAFTTIVLYQLFQVLNCRSDYSIFRVGFFSNKWLIAAILFSVAMQLIVIYSPLSTFFGTVHLTLGQFGICVLVAATIFVFREFVKLKSTFLKH